MPAWIGTNNEHEVDIETKRRRFGRFVGLRGCESPVEYPAAPRGGGNRPHHGSSDDNDDDVSTEIENEHETEMEILDQMERMWEEALRRARAGDADTALMKKAGGV